MSLSKRDLSALQKAGQAVHAAAQAIGMTVRFQAENMVANVASNPFGAEAEQAFGQFRSLARLSQDLATVELQMRNLYAAALELARPEADVVVVPASRKTRLEYPKGAVQDVEAKPALASKSKARKSTKAAKTPGTANATGGGNKRGAGVLTGNDSKLLQYLQGVLSSDNLTPVTAAQMAKGAGLPAGSVGVSLKRLLNQGLIQRGARGAYRRSA